jgi:uncharacterized protein (DUF488 family)
MNKPDISLFTIGVYGYSEDQFFQALKDNQIDLFCDVRQRRGVRGSKYAFVNSTYLQQKLQNMGIGYLHTKTLAPTKEIREKQKEADNNAGVKKRQRDMLGEIFIKAYRSEILSDFDISQWLEEVGDAKRICLFCVEQAPAACHRSLATEHIALNMGLKIYHIVL